MPSAVHFTNNKKQTNKKKKKKEKTTTLEFVKHNKAADFRIFTYLH